MGLEPAKTKTYNYILYVALVPQKKGERINEAYIVILLCILLIIPLTETCFACTEPKFKDNVVFVGAVLLGLLLLLDSFEVC